MKKQLLVLSVLAVLSGSLVNAAASKTLRGVGSREVYEQLSSKPVDRYLYKYSDGNLCYIVPSTTGRVGSNGTLLSKVVYVIEYDGHFHEITNLNSKRLAGSITVPGYRKFNTHTVSRPNVISPFTVQPSEPSQD